MKYFFIAIPVIILFTASLLQGIIYFLWKFKTDDFFTGLRYINKKIRWIRLVEN